MNIDDQLIQRLATLSKLRFDKTSQQEIRQNLNKILSLVEKLHEVDTDGVDPLIYMSDELNVLREDVAEQIISKKDGLQNAPDKDSDYFKVPKVISKNK